MELKDHDLTPRRDAPGILYDETLVKDAGGKVAPGLHTVRITLDNPSQLNSYTTDMVKGVILGLHRASNDRAAVAVVFTGSGHRAFCTGGNTAEYAEYYAGRPEEYRLYMRLFNDMVSAILTCDKPLLDREVDALVTKLALTMPGCLSKTIESVRKHKLEHWDRNKETNRAWLALNMMTEGRAGFRAFHEGTKECREADFLLLRRRLAEGRTWSEELLDEVLATARGKRST